MINTFLLILLVHSCMNVKLRDQLRLKSLGANQFLYDNPQGTSKQRDQFRLGGQRVTGSCPTQPIYSRRYRHVSLCPVFLLHGCWGWYSGLYASAEGTSLTIASPYPL